jgi:hypothetical protein
MDDTGQQKTRFPYGRAGLYIKPDETGRTFGGDAGKCFLKKTAAFSLLAIIVRQSILLIL